jgi:hypothetical protein
MLNPKVRTHAKAREYFYDRLTGIKKNVLSRRWVRTFMIAKPGLSAYLIGEYNLKPTIHLTFLGSTINDAVYLDSTQNSRSNRLDTSHEFLPCLTQVHTT